MTEKIFKLYYNDPNHQIPRDARFMREEDIEPTLQCLEDFLKEYPDATYSNKFRELYNEIKTTGVPCREHGRALAWCDCGVIVTLYGDPVVRPYREE